MGVAQIPGMSFASIDEDLKPPLKLKQEGCLVEELDTHIRQNADCLAEALFN